MSAVPFDTLKFARHLEASGLPASSAAGAAEALADALTGADLATKGDIAGLRNEMKGEFNALRSEHKSDNAMLRLETKSDIELARRDVTIKLGSMLILGVGVILAALRYMPLHP